MSGGQRGSDLVESMLVLRPSDVADEPMSLRGQLAAAGFVPRPICVIGTVDDGEYCAEIFEEEASYPSMPPRFLVRLRVRGECEHLFTLADLPDLLEHFDRLAPLLTHTVETHKLQAGAQRARASAGTRARRGSQR